MQDTPIDVETVDLNFSTPGPDEIHLEVIKEMSTVVSEPLRRFSDCIDSGRLLIEWKSGIVNPIFRRR